MGTALVTFLCLWISIPCALGQSIGDLRLVTNGFDTTSSGFGRLEVYYRSSSLFSSPSPSWGTVCGDAGFDSTAASIACGQLGYSYANLFGTVDDYGIAAGSGEIWFTYIFCSTFDTITRLDQCSLLSSSCNHTSDVVLSCSNTVVDPVRLVSLDGRTSSLTAGRLEIQIEGTWGTVCDDLFGSAEADTACRQLGFPAGAISWESASILGYSSSSPIWLDDLECSSDGSDTLRECSHGGIGIHNCQHSEDVILSCLGDGSLRLIDSFFSSSTTFSHEGRLEIYYNGEWGTVCDDSFGSREADVACEQLGFSGAENYGNSLGYPSASSTTAILLDNVICFSFDTTLLECSNNGIGVHNCGHSEDVELICSTTSTSLSNLTSVVGTIVGVVVAGVVFLFVCIPVCICICIACSTSKNRRRNVNRRVVGTPHSSAVVTTTTTTTAAAAQQNYGNPAPYPAAYPTQPQQAPPPHPSTVLQDAPPPSYKDVAAYPPQAAYPPPGAYNQPPRAPYNQPPSGAPYNQPPGAPYNQPPSGAPYNQPPPGAPYNQPPSGAPYNQPPPGAPYNQPPPGAPYNQPPGAPYNQPPGAPYDQPPEAPYPIDPAYPYPVSSEKTGVPSAPPPSAPPQ